MNSEGDRTPWLSLAFQKDWNLLLTLLDNAILFSNSYRTEMGAFLSGLGILYSQTQPVIKAYIQV